MMELILYEGFLPYGLTLCALQQPPLNKVALLQNPDLHLPCWQCWYVNIARSCCALDTKKLLLHWNWAALPKDAGWECSSLVREQWLMAEVLTSQTAVFKSSVLKSISSSRYNFCLFTELFWCVLEKKKLLSRYWQAQDTFRSPNFIQINDVISYW